MENLYGNDTIWGVNGLSTGNTLVFRTENDNATTGYTYGRSYLRRQSNNVLVDYTNFGGVFGATWAESNSTKPLGWYATTFSVNFN